MSEGAARQRRELGRAHLPSGQASRWQVAGLGPGLFQASAPWCQWPLRTLCLPVLRDQQQAQPRAKREVRGAPAEERQACKAFVLLYVQGCPPHPPVPRVISCWLTVIHEPPPGLRGPGALLPLIALLGRSPI